MRKIHAALREEMHNDQYYESCCRKNTECQGRITWEHTLIYGGKQINEKWAIIPLCEYHHAVNKFQDGGDLRKEINVWIALNRASNEELRKYSKAVDYIALRTKLNKKYG
tara:strand:+ start:490 stop:819 length:330 start_codon:yes stop_codon:yes gene_type:complete